MSYRTPATRWESGNTDSPTTHNILTPTRMSSQQRRMRAASIAALPYYDVEFNWVPTALLRRTAYRVYPHMRNAVEWMESCGQQLVWWLGLDESGYEDQRQQQRERQYAELQEMYRREVERDEALCEAKIMEMIMSREEGKDDVESHMRTSGIVTITDRNLADVEKDGNSVGGINNSDGVNKEKLDIKTSSMRKPLCMNIPSGFPIDELPEEIVQ
ncbi:hypothetical protein LSM04_001909 [Trypanosoma melophagium]|uniref:uncharacterized protein n=1 Tax=Trypanosoma melophagium TaxID=715481 RepID=UPI00351A4E9B|nr:hypothetical protein LSM04_001909 [Trypanosoma melophagium]